MLGYVMIYNYGMVCNGMMGYVRVCQGILGYARVC